jgi:hypothetical protein
MTRIEINEDCIVFSHSSRTRARCEVTFLRLPRLECVTPRARARDASRTASRNVSVATSLLAHAREMRGVVPVTLEQALEGHSSRTRARCESSHLSGDQPQSYEDYVIPVMTPWSASPAPGPVARH